MCYFCEIYMDQWAKIGIGSRFGRECYTMHMYCRYGCVNEIWSWELCHCGQHTKSFQIMSFLVLVTKNRSHPKVFHELGLNFNLQQNGHHWNAPFMLITMVRIPASYLIPTPRYIHVHVPTCSCHTLGWTQMLEYFFYQCGHCNSFPSSHTHHTHHTYHMPTYTPTHTHIHTHTHTQGIARSLWHMRRSSTPATMSTPSLSWTPTLTRTTTASL